MVTTEQRASAAGGRLAFIDVLRLVASLQMIQGHAISAVLAPSYKSGSLYAAWTFARGLTSVMFLFAAGFSFALAQAKGSASGRTRRALWLIALGYLMHAPFAIVLGAPVQETLQAALRVDVLQCIGVSLLALELLSHRYPRAGDRAELGVLLALASFILAPLGAHVAVDGPWRPLANYVTTNGGSLFPLVPWLGYALAGFGLGTATRDTPARIPSVLTVAGGCALLLGLAAWSLQPRQPLALSPGYCLVKLACVSVIAGALALGWRGRGLPKVLTVLAGETLFLYVSHVVILYADQVGLEARWRGQHSPWFGLVLAFCLLILCSAGALAWRSLRRPLASGTRAPQTP
jgi:uncharacterized membrane protein